MPRKMLIVFLILMLISSCALSTQRLIWKPKVYLGDPSTQSLVREGEKSILASSEEFRGRMCYTPQELRDLKQAEIDLINKCEKWKQE